MNPGSGDKKEDNQRWVFYSASFVMQEGPGIPVRIKQICTAYSSTAHQHVCTKDMPIKVGLHPGNKAGPFKSHGIIPSWCNILLRIRILRIYRFGWLRIFILRNSETSAEIYLSQNRISDYQPGVLSERLMWWSFTEGSFHPPAYPHTIHAPANAKTAISKQIFTSIWQFPLFLMSPAVSYV